MKIDRVVSGVGRYIRKCVTYSHDTFCIDVLTYEFQKQKMNSQQIRKLPGTKKEFPYVKSKIDNRKTVPAQSAKADVAPLVTNKVGFGYQGFGSTSITAAIPKHEISRLADQRDKKIHHAIGILPRNRN